MIIVIRPGTSSDRITELSKRVEDLGLKSHIIEGVERTVIAAVGDERERDLESMISCSEVENVLPILASYKVASRETKQEPTVVKSHDLTIGGGQVGIIAGPCSVESEEQIIETARAVRDAGAKGLRGGAFKPRTSPYSFQGLKEEGLKMLATAREETGLAVVTEVMTPHHVDMIVEYADVLQIGARNMQNYHLLQAVGETRKPVLLKRGPAAHMDEFLLAAEYILDQGNQEVILCERGIRTFEKHTRFTLPLASIAYLHEKTHLPIVIDPSHGTGVASMVPSMCAASIAARADGLIIEVHPNPSQAASDGPQSLTPQVFAETMQECSLIAKALGLTLS